MTNKWVAIVLVVTGTLFTACSKDDTNKTEVNPLIGEWKAETLTYTYGVTNTHPFNDPYFKKGCATDYITLNASNTASLIENNKVEEECVNQEFTGVWTNETITLKEANREIISVNSNELVLVYDLSFMGGTLPVTVKYSRVLAQ